MLGDAKLVEAVLSDYHSAPISPREKALFALVEKINHDPRSVTQADIDHAGSAGWSDEALYDTMTVCALFNCMTTWADAAGVDGLTAEACARSGKRLAAGGYAAGDE